MYQKGNKELIILSLYLGDYSRKIYLREMSRLSGIPLKTTQRILADLVKGKILKSEISGKNKYFGLNLDNIKTKSYLLQAEIYKTDWFLEKYSFFKSFLKEIKTNFLIIVFGSFAKFRAGKNSDIDILVVGKQKLPFHLLPRVHKIELSEKEFIKAIESKELLIKKIKENHIILNNHSYFINLMWNENA